MQTNDPRTPQSGPPADQTTVMKFAKESHPLPSLMGGGYGTYQVHPENFLISFLTHAAGILLLLWLLHITVIGPKIAEHHAGIVQLSAPPNLYHIGKNGNNAGGGGDASKLKASTGTPPRAALQQFTPPQVLPQRESKLQVEPTIIADLKIQQSNQIGDPLSKLMTPSNGSGIEFSEEARKAKYQGVVVLEIIVGTDGTVHNPRVVRSLGMGLDEKARERVMVWKFDPATKDGRPVAVVMNIEVAFNLY